MKLSETLKELRHRSGMTQEQLADQLHVSRQAVTKWETGQGIPEIDNLIALSDLFHITVDELLKAVCPQPEDFLFESLTLVDLEGIRHLEMKLGGADQVEICGGDGDKIGVLLSSDTLSEIQQDFKVKLDENGQRLEVRVLKRGAMTEARARKELRIRITVPQSYTGAMEVETNAALVRLQSLQAEKIELGGRIGGLRLKEVRRHVELDSDLDLQVICKSLPEQLDINQRFAVSHITVPQSVPFAAASRGRFCRLSFEAAGQETEDFTDPQAACKITLNGLKSELIVERENAASEFHQ